LAAQGEVSIPGSPTSTMKRSSLPPLNSVEEEELLSAANTLTPERGVTHVYTEGVGRKGPDSSSWNKVQPDAASSWRHPASSWRHPASS
jgi:hypothetical protein